MKLTIELIPEGRHLNARKFLTSSEWDKVRRKCYSDYDNKCDSCGLTGKDYGFSHELECHEEWFYDTKNKRQVLINLVALCPMCHKAKHMFYNTQQEYFTYINHLSKINNMTFNDMEFYYKSQKKKIMEYDYEGFILDIRMISSRYKLSSTINYFIEMFYKGHILEIDERLYRYDLNNHLVFSGQTNKALEPESIMKLIKNSDKINVHHKFVN